MLALMTSVNGLFTPYIDGVVNGKWRKTKRIKEREEKVQKIYNWVF